MASQPFYGLCDLHINTIDYELCDDELLHLQEVITKALIKRIGKKHVHFVEILGYDGEYGSPEDI